MRYFYLVVFFFPFVFSACKKPVVTTCENSPFTVLVNENFGTETNNSNYENSFFIINEGGFTYGNASISAYEPHSKNIVNNLFQKVNEYNLGDIAQSLKTNKELSYICINNSQKIEVVQTKTFERLRTITGFSSPRYMEFINDTDALVTDLYENSIQIIHTENGCLLGEIQTSGWTEEILKAGNNYFAIERNSIGAETKFAHIITLNVIDFKVTNRVEIPVEPNSIIIDNENNFWILSSGAEAENKFPQLIKWNTQTQSIEKSFSFSDFQNIPQNLSYNASENALYFNKAHQIYKMSTSDTNLTSTPFFSSAAQIIYGLDIHSSTNQIYICDAVDYVSAGKIWRYSATGNLLDEFTVGVLPNKVIF